MSMVNCQECGKAISNQAGKCPNCGTTMCAMMSKDNAEKAIKSGAKKAYLFISSFIVLFKLEL